MVIYTCNIAGPYHIENDLPCQDSFAVFQNDDFSILAVADGLGSEKHADIGADVAAKTAVAYCSDHVRVTEEMPFEEIKKIMNNGLVNAYKAVLTRSSQDGNDSDQYDTTLCLAIYDGKCLYYAQSGDSGLVALLENGEYYRVTSQQRDEEGRVFPLCCGPEKWEFGVVNASVSGFMLMTDGVFDQVCPKLLRHCDIDINIPIAAKFIDHFDCTEKDVPELQTAVHEYLEKFPRYLIDDDKTVVVLINPDRIPAKKEDAYYAIPDWQTLHDEAEKKLQEDAHSVCDAEGGGGNVDKTNKNEKAKEDSETAIEETKEPVIDVQIPTKNNSSVSGFDRRLSLISIIGIGLLYLIVLFIK